MLHAYTEDQLAKQPAIGLFAELGWAIAEPLHTGIAGEPHDAGLLGCETKSEVVLVSRLRVAQERLNPALPPEAIAAAEWNWTPALDPYWPHTGLMVDPSANLSA